MTAGSDKPTLVDVTARDDPPGSDQTALDSVDFDPVPHSSQEWEGSQAVKNLAGAPRATVSPIKQAHPLSTCLTGRRVLAVDDNAELLSIVSRKLTKLGCRVTAIPNSTRAWEAFRALPHSFDLVITDYDMPSMNGGELARCIQGLRPELPVVLLSGSPEASIQAGWQDKFSLILTKPVSLKLLQGALEELLHAQRTGA